MTAAGTAGAPWWRALPDASATEALGDLLAACCRPGLIVYLIGELGAGKTTLVRGFLRGLGHAGAVTSPTYTLMEPYQAGGLPVCHFDLYRLGDPDELEFLGARDYFDGGTVCLVEWPDRAAGALPAADLEVRLEYGGGARHAHITAASEAGRTVVACLTDRA